MNKYATIALVCLSILVVSCNSLEKAGNVLITEITKSASPPEARPRDAEQIKKSVVRITAKESGQGTGFVVGVNGDTVYILTAYHVVKDDSTPNVEFFGEPREFQAKVLENDDKVDISLLAVTGSIPSEAIPLYMGNNFVLKQGESVFTFGFPLNGGDWAHDELSYSSPRGREILFSGSDIKEGNSGGPLIRGDEVVGMVTGVTDFAYALSAVSIREFLRGAKGGEIVLDDMERWQGAKWHQSREARLKERTMLGQRATTEAEEKLPEGIIIAFAAVPGSDTLGGNAQGREELSVYTKFLLQEIQKPQKIEEVFQNVTMLVKKDTTDRQIPWYSSSLSGESFYLGGCSKTSSNSVKQLALVIGNANYSHPQLDPLKGPINDAPAIAKLLKEKGFEVLLRTDANLSEMLESIQEFLSRLSSENGVGLFYFSGYGGRIVGEDYLVPVDFELQSSSGPDRGYFIPVSASTFEPIERIEEARSSYKEFIVKSLVSVDSIVEQMQSANSKLNIVILDSGRTKISLPEGK